MISVVSDLVQIMRPGSVCCQEVGEGRDDGIHSALQNLNAQVFECQRLDVDLQFLSDFMVDNWLQWFQQGFQRCQQLKSAPKSTHQTPCAHTILRSLPILTISYGNHTVDIVGSKDSSGSSAFSRSSRKQLKKRNETTALGVLNLSLMATKAPILLPYMASPTASRSLPWQSGHGQNQTEPR